MSVIKYDTIKNKAIEELRFRIYNSALGTAIAYEALLPAVISKQNPRALTEEWLNEAEKIISAWDVRNVGRLITLFPSCISAKLHGKRKTAEIDEDTSNWVVIFEN